MNLKKFVQDPRPMLLLDMLGALATACATGILFASDFVPSGIPPWILWAMAAVATGFACFDLAGLWLVKDARIPLAIIAILNLLYCIFSMVVCVLYRQELTPLVMIYFTAEVWVVVPLAFWELRIANR